MDLLSDPGIGVGAAVVSVFLVVCFMCCAKICYRTFFDFAYHRSELRRCVAKALGARLRCQCQWERAAAARLRCLCIVDGAGGSASVALPQSVQAGSLPQAAKEALVCGGAREASTVRDHEQQEKEEGGRLAGGASGCAVCLRQAEIGLLA
ncbi:uncharacterized protein LOC104583984 [Brachypodium distachyon]|uniref:Uncharacterized protein n=1 Tax=Brachypodium distachyon TaxID=15368 RepID=I1HZ82_BRADI|nr:uncharacterized protein LOC104583984 [Brachypodium distachyon]PNT66269.1 hypothetical protein BRADI_3g09404v3 [Brachypodium distachyon]|eukprot:XP_010236346.1 uncharacterized protein LOC104583984 [Brachypodium distachyon]